MRASTIPQVEAFRSEVRSFLRDSLPDEWKGVGTLDDDAFDLFVDDWRQRLATRGYVAASWPIQYGGGGRSELEAAVLAEELALACAPTGGPHDSFGINLLGSTMLHWGTEEQKRHFLPRIVSGIDRWCQGYSETEAGSDLASLRCRAELDGDEWIVNGQKIWTSRAQTANWIFLLVRTEVTSIKQQGITFLLCPLDQPGIEIRPIRMMSGATEFCEVFFTNARVPAENVVGEVGQGWKVAMTLLTNERGSTALHLPVAFRAELDRLIELAQSLGASKDPIVRQGLAASYIRVELMRYLGLRTIAAIATGHELGPEGSVFKLFWSEHHRTVTELAVSILGPLALTPEGRRPSSAILTDDPGARNSSASWTDVFLNARAGTIYAGTSEIQRNILAEMVLGLAKEPKANPTSWNSHPH